MEGDASLDLTETGVVLGPRKGVGGADSRGYPGFWGLGSLQAQVRCHAVSPCVRSLVLVLQSGQAVWDAASVKALALHVQGVLIPPVEQLLLVDYPLRTPPAADAAPPTVGFKLDEVSVSLKVDLAYKHPLQSIAPG